MGQDFARLFCGEEKSPKPLLDKRLSRQFMLVEEVSVPSTVLGESPHWCAITESLFYIDITAKTIFRYIPSSNKTESMQMDSAVGFAIPTSTAVSSKIIMYVGLEKNIVEVNFTTKEVLRIVSSLPSNMTVNCRFNDGKCNSRGQLYAGYMNIGWRDNLYGNVYQLTQSTSEAKDAQMELRPMFEIGEFHLPNGSAWEKNGTVFYIDSGKHTISCYSEGVSANKSNVLSRVSCVYTLGENDRSLGYMLDGMTIDCDGKLWVALVGASCLIRINPEDGKEVMRLRLPINKPTACTFGGPNLSDLYITSRGDNGTGKMYVARLDGISGLSPGVPVAVSGEAINNGFFAGFF